MKRFLILSLAIIAPLLIILYYYNYDENNTSHSIQCSFYQITGLQCPGCGGQRAFHYLLHGEALKSLRYNALLILTIPILSFFYYSIIQVYGFKNELYFNHHFSTNRLIVIMLIILMTFFIVRNLPYFPFTYLSPPKHDLYFF